MGKFKKIVLTSYDELMLVGELYDDGNAAGLKSLGMTKEEFFDTVCQAYNEITRKLKK